METVWLHSLAERGAGRTDRHIDDPTAAFEPLAGCPEAGTPCANLRAGYRKHPVIRHVVHCRKTGCGIEIMRILHDRMLAARRF